MPEEKDKINDDDKTGDSKEKDKEVTLESLAEIIKGQAGLIESLTTKSTSDITQVTQVMQAIQEKYGLMESDMHNLTNLLGGLTKPDVDKTDEVEDLTDPDNIKKLISKTITDNKQAESETVTKESKTYWKEYGVTAQEHMDEEGPDGKPLSKEAREGIKQLMIDTPAEKTGNATRDAQKGFRKASRIFFGLDKTHGFKGGELGGTGGGGGEIKGGNKKVYKLTDQSKKLLKDIGETEEWGQEMLAKKTEEAAV